AVREQQRDGLWADTGLVDEVHVDAAQRHRELSPRVELSFPCAPIVAVAPVGDERFHVREVRAVAPRLSRDLVRPPHAIETRAEVIEHGVRNADRERTGGGHGRIIDVGDDFRPPTSPRRYCGVAQEPKFVPADVAYTP